MAEKPKIFNNIYRRTSKWTYRPPASGGKLYKHTYSLMSDSVPVVIFDSLYSSKSVQQYSNVIDFIKDNAILFYNQYVIEGLFMLVKATFVYTEGINTVQIIYDTTSSVDNIPSGETLVINTNDPTANTLTFDDTTKTITGGSLKVNGNIVSRTFIDYSLEDFINFQLNCEIKEV